MKKLELETLQNAMIESTSTDLFTARQAETIREMDHQGIIRIMRDEKLKANLVVMEWKLGTGSTAKAAMNASESNQETQTENEGVDENA